MKKTLFTLAIGFVTVLGIAQTAPNFTANDCSANNHDLYTELNAGKVVVIAFVMPCSACIGPSLAAYNEVQNYQSTNPGRVVFYLQGSTTCTTLKNWANTNSMGGAVCFPSGAISQNGYGTAGMPKVVVLGGPNYMIYFNQNSGVNVPNFDNAVNQALAATGISQVSQANFQLSLFPNPVTGNKVTLQYQLNQASAVSFEVYNTLGSKVMEIQGEKTGAGKHETPLDINSLSNGVYFLKLYTGELTQTLKFTVDR